jgi:hypothetical protein
LDDESRVPDRVTEAVDRALRLVGPPEHALERLDEEELEEDTLSS